MSKELMVLLLLFLVVCAVSVSITKNLLTSLIIYMAFSLVMSIIWVCLQSPDLAITEAAVGAGVTSILFFVTLKKIRAIDESYVDDKPVEKSRAIDESYVDDKPVEKSQRGKENLLEIEALRIVEEKVLVEGNPVMEEGQAVCQTVSGSLTKKVEQEKAENEKIKNEKAEKRSRKTGKERQRS